MKTKRNTLARQLRAQLWLTPESRGLLRLGLPTFVLCCAAAVGFYAAGGDAMDYQLALVLSERLAMGARGGFGLLCLGVLVFESVPANGKK